MNIKNIVIIDQFKKCFLGELVCPDITESDQGAYSCEAINSQGICFAGQADCGQPGY